MLPWTESTIGSVILVVVAASLKRPRLVREIIHRQRRSICHRVGSRRWFFSTPGATETTP